jgi:hypothetical protein
MVLTNDDIALSFPPKNETDRHTERSFAVDEQSAVLDSASVVFYVKFSLAFGEKVIFLLAMLTVV